jgi:hypothetical protein
MPVRNDLYVFQGITISSGFQCVSAANPKMVCSNSVQVSPTTGFTMSLWFKTSSGGALGVLSEKQNPSVACNWCMYVNTSGYAGIATYIGGTVKAEGTTNRADNAWHHAVFVITNVGLTTFIDGAQEATVYNNSNMVVTESWTWPAFWWFGLDDAANAGWSLSLPNSGSFNGLLEDIRTFSRTMGSTEIAALYAAGMVTSV